MVDVYNGFEALVPSNPASLYASDGLHLSTEGYAYWETWAATALADPLCAEWLGGACVQRSRPAPSPPPPSPPMQPIGGGGSSDSATTTEISVGALNTNLCPSGSSKIGSAAHCRAAIELSLGSGPDRADQSFDTETDAGWPSGCYKHDDKYWFNRHASGGTNGEARPLCVSDLNGFATGRTLFVGDSDIDYWATHGWNPSSYNVGIGGYTCQNVQAEIDALLSTFVPTARRASSHAHARSHFSC